MDMRRDEKAMNAELLSALKDLERERGIEFEVLVDAIEAALISAYKKNFGAAQNVRVYIDRDTGEFKVFTRKNVVETVSDAKTEVGLEDARKENPLYDLEDVVEYEVTPRDFGRIAAQTAKQVVVQRLREAERDMIFEKYNSQKGDVVTGIIHRCENRSVYIDMGNTEVCLSQNEQIPGEEYAPGMRVKAYIIDVKKTTKGPQIQVSRTHPGFLERLFELEVPEILNGVIEVKSVAREAGYRSKVAVWSENANVDALGACVGSKGMRVQAVVSELRGEKIDVIKWSDEPAEFIASALSPAKVVSVDTFPGEKGAQVVVPDYQLSLAIGKEGQNARLAAKLTGWKIDIKSETQMSQILSARLEEERRAAAEAAEAAAEAAEAAAEAAEAAEAAAEAAAASAEATEAANAAEDEYLAEVEAEADGYLAAAGEADGDGDGYLAAADGDEGGDRTASVGSGAGQATNAKTKAKAKAKGQAAGAEAEARTEADGSAGEAGETATVAKRRAPRRTAAKGQAAVAAEAVAAEAESEAESQAAGTAEVGEADEADPGDGPATVAKRRAPRRTAAKGQAAAAAEAEAAGQAIAANVDAEAQATASAEASAQAAVAGGEKPARRKRGAGAV
jgi:N utilization substance protein A